MRESYRKQQPAWMTAIVWGPLFLTKRTQARTPSIRHPFAGQLIIALARLVALGFISVRFGSFGFDFGCLMDSNVDWTSE
jgi:hypothetical protein